MPKFRRNPYEEMMLEGAGSGAVGAGGGAGKASVAPAEKSSWSGMNPKPAGSKRARDQKEYLDKEPELSGKMRFRETSPYDDYDFGSKTPGFSDDYAKGGKVSSASSRADGCAQRGKTKGRMR